MAFSNYSARSVFWSTIKRAVGTQSVTAADFYDELALKIFDCAQWLFDEVNRRSTALANTAAGTKGTVIGTVDLRTLSYDSVTGDLVGKTLLIQSDNSGLKTVTFSTGPGPTGPADVVTQILAATSGNPGALLDAAGHLNLSSSTTGGSGTITVVSGTAVTTLGFTNGQNATGVSSGADGLNLVGGATITGAKATIPAGTLRSMLLYIVDHFDKAATPAQAISNVSAAVTIDVSKRVWYVSSPTPASQAVTLRSTGTPAPVDGDEIDFMAFLIPNGKNVAVQREDATQIIVMTGGASVDYGSGSFKFISGKWRLKMACGETGVTLVNDP